MVTYFQLVENKSKNNSTVRLDITQQATNNLLYFINDMLLVDQINCTMKQRFVNQALWVWEFLMETLEMVWFPSMGGELVSVFFHFLSFSLLQLLCLVCKKKKKRCWRLVTVHPGLDPKLNWSLQLINCKSKKLELKTLGAFFQIQLS